MIDDRSPSEASMDSDDDSLKPKEAWYKSPAALTKVLRAKVIVYYVYFGASMYADENKLTTFI